MDNKPGSPSDAPAPKQPRLLADSDSAVDDDNRGSTDRCHDFGRFRLREVLDSSMKAKYVALLGRFDGHDGGSDGDDANEHGGGGGSDDSAVLLLEKEAFPVEALQNLTDRRLALVDDSSRSMAGNSTAVVMHNDVWHKYRLRLSPDLCWSKATLVHPATERLVAKYRRRPTYLVEETPEDFNRLTEPALAAAGAKHSLAWVRNLLDGTAERDRLVHEDPNPETGYMLHADLKWDGRRVDDLYCLAVCRREGLHSLRQLGEEHLPLLDNLLQGGRAAISARYGVPASQLRVFFHYQPSFYHLHAHFTHVTADWPGQQVERAHLVATVTNNIRLMPDYYTRATLTFTVKESDALFEAYKSKLGL